MASISTTTPLALPNLSYHPNFEQYQLRAKLQLLSEESTQDLPDRYPKRLDSALVWEGKDVNTPEKQQEWLLHLSGEQLNEINRALRHFQALEKPLGFISPSTFPLPTLLSVLRLTSHNIHFGRGFAVLRGLDVDSYSREENIIIYAGISSHIGSIRGRQDNFHNGKPADVVLAHIQNFDRTTEKKGYGLAACTTDNVVFHTDVGDIVSLLALQEAATGGESLLASSGRVYNELVETRPDLIKTLAEDWVIDRLNGQQQSFVKRPLLYQQIDEHGEPRIIIQFSRRSFTGYGSLARSSELPPLTESQAVALDALHFLAKKHSLVLDFQKGDIQYVNNLSILHARNGYTEDTKRQRHLLRLWIRDEENAWQTPEPLRARWARIYNGVTEESQVFPLEPAIRSAAHHGKNNETTGIVTGGNNHCGE